MVRPVNWKVCWSGSGTSIGEGPWLASSPESACGCSAFSLGPPPGSEVWPLQVNAHVPKPTVSAAPRISSLKRAQPPLLS